MDSDVRVKLGERFVRAVEMAIELHADQTRKGTSTPYIGHLLGVCSLVIDYGGDEDEIIAALLHDGPEDQGGVETLERIRAEFGDGVAAIVEGCTDTFEEPKPDWRPRKEGYIEHLKSAPAPVLRVSLADKLHNARAILLDYRTEGDALWGRFSSTKEENLWYYRSLVEVFLQRSLGPMACELKRTVDELQRLTTQSAKP